MRPVLEMNKKELLAELKKRNLNTSGAKDVLKERLLNAVDQQLSARLDNLRQNGEGERSIEDINRLIREKQEELERLQQQVTLSRRSSIRADCERQENISRRVSIHTSPDRPNSVSRRSSFHTVHERSTDVSRRDSVRTQVSMREMDRDFHDQNTQRSRYGDYDEREFRQPMNYFTFKYIENSMNTFCGSDNYSVRFFVEEFEQNARMLNWNDDQEVVYAKWLLRGKAKLLIRTVFCSTWIQLKGELIKEFGIQLSSGEAQRLLQSTKMKADDDLGEYVLKMREMGKNNNIDKLSVTQYIIEGIYDNHSNKAMLYGATNIPELKTKLEAYKKFKSVFKAKVVSSDSKKSNGNKSENKGEKDDKRCHLCGDKSHLQSSCPTKEKGMKYLKCNGFGHRAIDKECPKYEEKEKKETEKKLMCLSHSKPMKKVRVINVAVGALIDTGSEINAMKRSVFNKLKISHDVGVARKFHGAGGAEISTNRFFTGKMRIDDDDYESRIYILNDDEIYDEMIIGMELLYEHEVIFNRGEIAIKKKNGSGNGKPTRLLRS